MQKYPEIATEGGPGDPFPKTRAAWGGCVEAWKRIDGAIKAVMDVFLADEKGESDG